MIQGDYPFKVNGVLYRAALLKGVDPFSHLGPALTVPAYVGHVVQGDPDKVQPDPTVPTWSITGWDGGEGQIWFDPKAPNRHLELFNVDPFTEPGKLMPGLAMEITQDSTGAANFNDGVVMAFGSSNAIERLFGISRVTAGKVYEWDFANQHWDAGTTLTGPANVVAKGPCDIDNDYLWWCCQTDGKVYKWDLAAAAATNVVASGFDSSVDYNLRELGDYIYVMRAFTYAVWEIAKTATAYAASSSDIIDSAPAAKGYDWPDGQLVVGDNGRLYAMLVYTGGTTKIREIIPTTAAGQGYGREVAVFPGFVGTSIWWHSGMLFISGWADANDQTERTILYWTPGGNYGTLGYVRQAAFGNQPGRISGNNEGGSLLSSAFALQRAQASPYNVPGLFLIDTVKGGFAQLASMAGQAGARPDQVLKVRSDYFITAPDSTKVYRAMDGKYEGTNSWAISPWHDFGLADSKILSSFVLSCEALPADWTVEVQYAVDGSTSFTSAGSVSTTGSTGGTFLVSTAAAPKSFRALQVKIVFSYGGAGTPTTRPKVLGVDARAQFVKKGVRFQVYLDLSDDRSGTSQALSGAAKYADLLTFIDSNTSVVEFLNGWPYRNTKTATTKGYDTYNVTVEDYEIHMPAPGEGWAKLILKPVV